MKPGIPGRRNSQRMRTCMVLKAAERSNKMDMRGEEALVCILCTVVQVLFLICHSIPWTCMESLSGEGSSTTKNSRMEIFYPATAFPPLHMLKSHNF